MRQAGFRAEGEQIRKGLSKTKAARPGISRWVTAWPRCCGNRAKESP